MEFIGPGLKESDNDVYAEGPDLPPLPDLDYDMDHNSDNGYSDSDTDVEDNGAMLQDNDIPMILPM